MTKTSIIGLDLAKRVFQAHGARADGSVAFRKKLSREKVLAFLALKPRCVVAMEACGSAHHFGRAIRDLGHEVRLIAPSYVAIAQARHWPGLVTELSGSGRRISEGGCGKTASCRFEGRPDADGV